MTSNSKIYVTKPRLPSIEAYTEMLKEIWATKSLTNNGNFHRKLEMRICEYLDHEHVSIQSNGTLALWSAIRALGCSGEIITTPFSFIATSHAIRLNNCDPVFVDIEADGYNLDPNQIERSITEKTSAILAVHCYGHLAQVDKIQKLADKYQLKVIYDAAHAFGVQDQQGSILKYGDMSAVSFHATKVFSTVEGGAIVCKTAEEKKMLDQIKNFGIVGEFNSASVGLNAKMSELHAAFGLLQLDTLDAEINRRSEIAKIYRRELHEINGIGMFKCKDTVSENNSYFPILIQSGAKLSCECIYTAMREESIYARRYFYPLITDQDSYKNVSVDHDLVNAKIRSEQVLCLPIYPDLTDQEVIRVCGLIRKLLQ